MAAVNPERIRRIIGRFRVLIIGRANAGKTTILQKVCNTTDQPEIYDAEGNKIDAAVVNGSIKRGNHTITNEMVFKSNPGFVFHDSCGFEAGSEEEFEDMKTFISQRVHATKLEERIHAIWYCIPMDEYCRTFQRSEEKFFFECDTGHVPVIAVFTKFEALRPVAYGEIKKEVKGVSAEERSKRIAQCVEELFTKTGVCDRLCDPENRTRPKFHVRLENMHKPNTNCDTLLERTTFALDNEELRLCLVSTQQSNLELCIRCAVATLVHRAHQQSGLRRVDHEVYQYDIVKWFPHLQLRREERRSAWERAQEEWDKREESAFSYERSRQLYERSREERREWKRLEEERERQEQLAKELPDFNDELFKKTELMLDGIIRVLQPLVAKRSMYTSAANRIVQTGIATIIVLEYSAFLVKNWKQWECIESAMDYYLKSSTAVLVEQGAKEMFGQGYDGEELGKKILEFILENRLSKDLTAKK